MVVSFSIGNTYKDEEHVEHLKQEFVVLGNFTNFQFCQEHLIFLNYASQQENKKEMRESIDGLWASGVVRVMNGHLFVSYQPWRYGRIDSEFGLSKLNEKPHGDASSTWQNSTSSNLEKRISLYTNHDCRQTVPQYFIVNSLWAEMDNGEKVENCATSYNMTDVKMDRHKVDLLKFWPDLSTYNYQNSKKMWKEKWEIDGSCCSDLMQPENYLAKAMSLRQSHNMYQISTDGGRCSIFHLLAIVHLCSKGIDDELLWHCSSTIVIC
ncbi:hypothetical protein L6164_005684 [Bauhinia variegata]|uniref:Uncharacterized protein n=1 Tax=Bauhinia variegata TaxID=167791 RepID=A0ACB9PS18_BAUVA|nr:hypothetical protein L6164_005684 [Bauhinia variegata]